MVVAYELGKTLEEVKDMPLEELADWLAFFKTRERLQSESDKKPRRA